MSISTYLHTSKRSHKCLPGKELSETNLHLNWKKRLPLVGLPRNSPKDSSSRASVREGVKEVGQGMGGTLLKGAFQAKCVPRPVPRGALGC